MAIEENEADKTATDVKTEDQMTEEERTQLAADEDFILNFDEEKDGEDEDKVAELRKALANAKTTIHQKRHYRDLAKGKVEKPAAEVKPVAETKPAAGDEKNTITTADKVEFRQDNPTLTKEIVNEIAEYAQATGKTLKAASETEAMKALISKRTSANEVDEASISPSRKPTAKIAEVDWSTATEAQINAMRQSMGQ